MSKQKGFSIIGLMAVVAIIAIMAVISLPVYNQYIERTKVAKAIPAIGTYKQDIASCFMRKNSLNDCDDGRSGIHPGLSNEGNILSLEVINGNIALVVDAQNHVIDVEPIELVFVANPAINGSFPTLDWSLYCSDYTSDSNSLVKECIGSLSAIGDTDSDDDGVDDGADAFPNDPNESSDLDGDGIGDNADTDKDGDGFDNNTEEQLGSDPLDPDSTPVLWERLATSYSSWSNIGSRNYTNNWTPAVNNQVNDFTQTRNYSQEQQRTVTERERNKITGEIRIVSQNTEIQTISDSVSRTVNVSSSGWTANGSPTNISYSNVSSFGTGIQEQTKTYTQNFEKEWLYKVNGSVIETRAEQDTRTETVPYQTFDCRYNTSNRTYVSYEFDSGALYGIDGYWNGSSVSVGGQYLEGQYKGSERESELYVICKKI